MKLPNINYQWNAKDLAMEDAAAPVRIAGKQAQVLQNQANTAAKWASAANSNSNTARAWGKLYETAGQMPNEMAKIATKYDSARADARITARMTEFSKKYDDKSKTHFTPDELRAEGIEFESTAKDIEGNEYERTEIPKHEIYGQAYNKYASNAKTEAENEFGWLSFDDEWKLKTDMTINRGSAEAHQKAGSMAHQYLITKQEEEAQLYMDKGLFNAALKVYEGCIEGNVACNAKRHKIRVAKDVYHVNDALVSGKVSRMEEQRNMIANGLTEIPKDKALSLINQLNTAIEKQNKSDESERVYNDATKFLDNISGQKWSAQEKSIGGIADAKVRKEALSQMRARRASYEANEVVERKNIFNSAYDEIVSKNLPSVPPQVTNAKDHQALKKVIEARAKNREITTDTVKYGELLRMSRDPSTKNKFVDVNLNEYRGVIGSKDIEKLQKAQDDIKFGRKDTGLTTLRNRIDNSLFNAMNVKSAAGLGTGDNREKFYLLQKDIEDTIMDLRESGQNVTREIENKVIADSISAHTVEGIFFDSDYEVTDFSMDELKNTNTIFRTYGIQPTNEMRYYLTEKPAIIDNLRGGNKPVTPNNIKLMYEIMNK